MEAKCKQCTLGGPRKDDISSWTSWQKSG